MSNSFSSVALEPLKPLTTLNAQVKYSLTRFSSHPAGILSELSKSLRLYSLSASLTSFASGDFLWAVSIWICFRVCFGNVLSSVTSATICFTLSPNTSPISSIVVSVSSTVSCKRAACMTIGSVIFPSLVKMCATPIG